MNTACTKCMLQIMEGLEEVQAVINTAEVDLQAELERSDNPWLACYVTRLTGVRSTLELSPHRKNAELHARITALLQKKDEVWEVHGWDPPNSIKQELLRGIQRLLD